MEEGRKGRGKKRKEGRKGWGKKRKEGREGRRKKMFPYFSIYLFYY